MGKHGIMGVLYVANCDCDRKQSDDPVEIDRPFSVLWGANYILDECFPFVDSGDTKAMKDVKVAGQVFFAGGWSVVVQAAKC